MRGNKKRGVSPVVATVLLISIVLVIAAIIFFWARGFVAEEGTKFEKNVRLVCEDISFRAGYSGGYLSVVNQGDVPIFRVKLKIVRAGGHQTKDISDYTDLSPDWPYTGLNQAEIFSGASSTMGSDFSGATEVVVIPALLGKTGKGEKVYVCDERHGYKIKL